MFFFIWNFFFFYVYDDVVLLYYLIFFLGDDRTPLKFCNFGLYFHVNTRNWILEKSIHEMLLENSTVFTLSMSDPSSIVEFSLVTHASDSPYIYYQECICM